MLIARAELDGRRADVRLCGERVAAVAPRLDPRPGEPVLDAEGGALLPGLHDHHLHVLALAAADGSVRCGPPAVRDARDLGRALRAAAADDSGWLRGVGYGDAVAGALDRHALDRLRPDLPVRIQHRSGALWVVNSAGVQRLGLEAPGLPEGVERDRRGRATGRLYRVDAWLRERLGPRRPPPLDAVGRRLAGFGVTGLTDATPGNGSEELRLFSDAAAGGALPQRIVLMGSEALPAAEHGPVTRGALKRILSETDLPGFDELRACIARAHAEPRAVALHCVTRAELVLAVGAFAAAGVRPGDRIEHAAVAPPELLPELAALPLTVVTQPNFIHERGDDYTREVDPQEQPWLYRGRGFLEAGVPLGGGTDAPFGDPDPWRAMRAAVERTSREGRCLGADEALAPERALALFTSSPEAPGGPARRVAPGAAADLCLLDRPWSAARRDLRADAVRAVFCRGALAFPREAATRPEPR